MLCFVSRTMEPDGRVVNYGGSAQGDGGWFLLCVHTDTQDSHQQIQVSIKFSNYRPPHTHTHTHKTLPVCAEITIIDVATSVLLVRMVANRSMICLCILVINQMNTNINGRLWIYILWSSVRLTFIHLSLFTYYLSHLRIKYPRRDN